MANGSAATLTVSVDAGVSKLVRGQAYQLLCAQASIARAMETKDFEKLSDAAVELCVASSQIYGTLSGELIGRTLAPVDGSPSSRRQPRKGSGPVR